MESLNWADWVIFGLLAISMVISFFRGFVREFMALAVWVAAVWVALTFADQVAPLIGERIQLPSARLAIAFGGLFVATLVAGGMLNFLLGLLVSQTGLSGTDRFLGLVFGAVRGLLLLIVAVSLLVLTPLPADPWWQQSVSLPKLERLASWVSGYLPEDFRGYLRDANDAIPALPGGAVERLDEPEPSAQPRGLEDNNG
ncbi:MAG: CvpA family protein [Lysobacterales bacterium]